jgi:hypothetical protein
VMTDPGGRSIPLVRIASTKPAPAPKPQCQCDRDHLASHAPCQPFGPDHPADYPSSLPNAGERKRLSVNRRHELALTRPYARIHETRFIHKPQAGFSVVAQQRSEFN